VLDLLLIALPRSAHGPLGTPTQTDQNLPHVSFVIAHAKLLLDQVRHPWASPQRSFIAQPLGTLQQQSVQPPPVLPAQARLATRPPRFPQPRLTLSAILLHPAGYGLPNHLDLASDGGLILASFVQADGLEAALLQSVKIASYTSRVSHVCLDAATSERYRYIMRESIGGSNDLGTVFKITPSGTLTTLHTFDGTDGSQPLAGLVQGTDGNFYGTTYLGGSKGDGEIFKITPSGTFNTLHSFCSRTACKDGRNPFAGLVQAVDGNLYGTTLTGGARGYGTVFKVTPSGTLTTLHSFCLQSGCPDGEFPQTGLVQATNGSFYGTTIVGGAYGCGTIFEITPSGTLTTLYSVCSQSGCPDGNYLYAGLIQATDGNLYGVMEIGGANDGGTIFRMTLSGTLTTLHSFCSQPACADGQYPAAGLVQDTNGNLYGTTADGGAKGDGAVFSFSVSLGPFVETVPTAAKVGAAVNILGTNLTGATRVNFNGKLATFTVVSSSEITTTVPVGATSGKVQVVTPSGALLSNASFRVLP
jgi:uncharacterized repeat protein (TIGR03803 family)